jgi:hypothetical protein
VGADAAIFDRCRFRPAWSHSVVLLVTVGKAEGPTGGGVLAQTAYIQRLNTSGGAPPSTGCALATHVGAFALVPYSADYFFYRKSQG